jgi:thioredoxin-like negative regulator of GroEL
MSSSSQKMGIEGRKALQELMEPANTLFLVKFVAPHCPSCETLTPLLQKLVADYGGIIHLVTIDMTEDPDLAMELGVRTAPTTIVFKGKTAIKRIAGLKPKKSYSEAIQKAL